MTLNMVHPQLINGDSGKVVSNNTSDKTAVLDTTATTVATKPPTTAAAAVNGNNQQAPVDNNNNNMSMNDTTTNTNKIAESSSPRRRIVKKRSDDFVYASDNKKLKSTATTTEKSIASSSATNTKQIALQQPPTKQPQVVQQQQKKPRKRPRKCPVKDTILIDIPVSISVDLGVAMKRTRRKRTKRIKQWLKSGTANKAADTTGATNNDDGGDAMMNDSIVNDDDDDEDDENPLLNPKQFGGSMIDYLEAKYVRGVMIDDIDERERAKERKKKKKKQKQLQSANGENGKDEDGEDLDDDDDDDDDSEGKASCYDSEDGWIDDSLLHQEVASQVIASSAYGMTQIEEEAKMRRKEDSNKRKIDDNGAAVDGDKTDDESSVDEAGAESDFEDGFFVNIGDLEMAEGWNGENDMIISPVKKKRPRKKRAKKPAATTDKKDDSKIVKKKTVKSKKEVGTKQKLAKAAEKKTKDKTAAKKSNKKKADESTTPKKKKKKESVDKGKVAKKSSPSDVVTATVVAVAADSSDQDDTKSKSSLSPKPKVSPEKEKAMQLKKLYKRRYTSCVKQIKEMTATELPRKARNKSTVKVSVNIPADKEIGDEIVFTNPNVPGQKLKVAIPAKANMEKRCFTVSVPALKVKEEVETRNNEFPKAFKEALYNYSNAYDDWVDAEVVHLNSLGNSKQKKEFKPAIEKQAKFNDMVKEFPKNLSTPIDVAYLKKIVRQEKSKITRREKRAAEALNQHLDVDLYIPQVGTNFSTIVFDEKDFQEKK